MSNTNCIELADKAAEQVRKYTLEGLPSCYKNVQEWLYDFYPDLPWDKDGSIAAINHILQNHKSVLVSFEKKFNFDLEDDLQKAIQELLIA
jgi:hypothetical protein